MAARPTEARLGGDPSIANKVRAFLFVRYYRNGEWEDRIEVRLLDFRISFLVSLTPPSSLWQVNLSGQGSSTLYELVMSRRRWTKLFSSNKPSNTASRALSIISGHGSSLPSDGQYKPLTRCRPALNLRKDSPKHTETTYNPSTMRTCFTLPQRTPLSSLYTSSSEDSNPQGAVYPL